MADRPATASPPLTPLTPAAAGAPAAAGVPAANATHDRRQWDELEAVLDKLDAQAELNPERNQRKAARAQFRRQHVRAHLSHPGGTVTACDVLTRDLSSGGLAFVHGGYVHVGTRVEVELRRNDAEAEAVHGVVMRCAHISRTWHSVGVKFDRPIAPEQFVGGGPARPAADADLAGGPTPLAGRILHVDEDELERRLLAHHLRHTALQIVGVACPAEAAERLGEAAFDLVLTELRFKPRPDAAAAMLTPAPARKVGGSPVDAFRAAGHAGPVAVCTAEAGEELLRSVAQRHVRGVLLKPYTAGRLLGRVAAWLQPHNAGDGGPLVSTLVGTLVISPAGHEAARDRLAAYVANLTKLSGVLSAAAAAGQADRCRSICLTVRGSATAHGFAALAEVAGTALAQLAPPAGDVGQARAALDRLAELCNRARVEPPARAA